MRLIAERLQAARARFVVFNQRHFADCQIELEISGGAVRGNFRIDGRDHPLEQFRAVYLRLMDHRCLPELDGQPEDAPMRQHCAGLHETMLRWADVAPACVVNRSAPSATNISKPYQAQIIRRHGFLVPETLITSHPEAVRAFQARHGRVVYKSISAIRSIVQPLEEADLARLERIRWCPTQFQAYVDGTDLRVHVAGDQVYATAVSSAATDYRYALQQTGQPAQLREVELSAELAERCVGLTRTLGMELSGIDLKVTPEDEVYCFEVNPTPAFSYYELSTGQAISGGIARRLMDASSSR
ncbi:MAG TPA: glutathione synthase [Candidatus Margulisiibacteriota bacterium]|nr:glutathione synthase [Candidatus Margulisiibacteriota bacterium]